ncbi:MAG: dihydroxy-acid dehydratase [Eisenbergiella sp.]
MLSMKAGPRLTARRMQLRIEAVRLWPEMLVVIRYEGPKGGPGMRSAESDIGDAGMGLDQCSPNHRRPFSGASGGASIGHVSPEAAWAVPSDFGGGISYPSISIIMPQCLYRTESDGREKRNSRNSAGYDQLSGEICLWLRRQQRRRTWKVQSKHDSFAFGQTATNDNKAELLQITQESRGK